MYLGNLKTKAFDIVNEIRILPPQDENYAQDDDDDKGIWFGWSGDNRDSDRDDGDDNYNDGNSSATSRSGTETRKIAHIQDKETPFDGAKVTQTSAQTQSLTDNVNSMTSRGHNLQDLDDNSGINENNSNYGASEKLGNRSPHELNEPNFCIFVPE